MGKKKAAGTRGAFAECPGGSSGVIRGAAGRHPGGLPAWDTRRNRRVPGENMLAGHVALSEASGEITLAGLAAHSGLPGSIRDSPGVSLGTRGLLGGIPEVVYGSGTRGQMASSGGIRRDSPGSGYSGTRGGLEKYPGGEVLRSALGTGGTFRR